MKLECYKTFSGLTEVTRANGVRQLVAAFADTPEGDAAFALFKSDLARNGGSLYDRDTRTYLVGDVAQISQNPA